MPDQVRTASKRRPLDWDDAQVFLAVARTGSLSGAARRLRVNHTTVARRLARLDESLGRPVFEKAADGYILTEAGRLALPEAEAMEEAAQRLVTRADASDEVSGSVRISAISSFIEHVVAPSLAGFVRAHPGLVIELAGEDRNVRLSRGEADIALRHGRPEAGQELTRRLCDVPYRLYGAPDYLARTHPDDRRIIGFSEDVERRSPTAGIVRQWAGREPLAMRCSTMGAQAAAAAAGIGLALLPEYIGERRANLVRAADRPAPDWVQPTWLVLRSDVRRIARVRLVADALVQALADGRSGP
jgi:DNA-binding transcriptional LysR family regulator